MMILTNTLARNVDEGGRKVANTLVRRMKQADPSVTVLSCGAEADGSDLHIPTNKLLLSAHLASVLWRSKERVLYVPTYARMAPTALRVLLLSMYTRRKLRVLLPMKSPIGTLARWMFRLSGAEIVCLSADARDFYRREVGGKVLYLRTGVDTKRFVPVDPARKAALRQKYGVPADRPVVLHIGHMNPGRNIGLLTQLDASFQAVLVVSKFEEDKELRENLRACPNLTLIETYQPHIEEICQLADVYLFPVEKALHCIDVPLSALEAAACGVPVVTTAYGEMKELMNREGFYPLKDTSPATLDACLKQAVQEGKNPRSAVLDYDWAHAVETLLKGLENDE